MNVTYQTDLATSTNQDLEIAALSSILSAIQALPESEENQILANILAALAPLATAPNQTTANTALASILASMATSANQTTANTALAAILSGMATAVNQATQTTKLTSIETKLTAPPSATLSSITQSATSQTVLAANPNRKGLYLYNDTGAKAYIAFAATAADTAFTLLLAPNSGQEINSSNVYTGVISAKWASGNTGKLQITEIV